MWRLFFWLAVLISMFSIAEARERRAEVTFNANLKISASSSDVRLWIPYPVTDEFQAIEEVSIGGNYSTHGVYLGKGIGNDALYAEWKSPMAERTLTYAFRVGRQEVVKKDFPKGEPPLNMKEFEKYLLPTSLGPTSGKVKQLAERITKDQTTILVKARTIYDWIIDNMHRDPQVKGCGIGDVERLLEGLGGKCTDIHSVFVALTRSVGIPSREIFGIRIPPGKEGDMSRAQHCWAEFYLPGYGWVPVDPADVRKIMLEKQLRLGEEGPYREYFFGAVDENRIAYGTGRDLLLTPPQKNGTINYFGYPYAEIDGKAQDDLFGFNLGYTISFKER